MNQFTPKSVFQSGTLLNSGEIICPVRSLSIELRQLAAHFHFHHALIHRLCPLEARLADTTYITTIRSLKHSNWTLGDLINRQTLDSLLAGNSPLAWFIEKPNHNRKGDVLDRLNLCSGVSVPFHNALGNHVALTLCDCEYSNVNLAEFAKLAVPLINAMLNAERSKNSDATALSSREADCLQWAAAGKTSLETGIILGLSPHTVNQYLTEATAKLKAVNRTHAVTKAVRLGLINLSAV